MTKNREEVDEAVDKFIEEQAKLFRSTCNSILDNAKEFHKNNCDMPKGSGCERVFLTSFFQAFSAELDRQGNPLIDSTKN